MSPMGPMGWKLDERERRELQACVCERVCVRERVRVCVRECVCVCVCVCVCTTSVGNCRHVSVRECICVREDVRV